MFDELMGTRIIVVEELYKWRGRVAGFVGPFAVLEDVTQVIGHSATKIEEEIVWGRTRVNLERAEAIADEEGTAWVPQTKATRGAKKV